MQAGDAVYGARNGALAEYVCVRDAVVAKPAGVTFEEAAAVPVAAVTALQGLRDKGRLQAGQKVLINGASGGVGTFAVQIAKALGAEVTAVCSTGNVELAGSLGADHVVDYTREDFTRTGPAARPDVRRRREQVVVGVRTRAHRRGAVRHRRGSEGPGCSTPSRIGKIRLAAVPSNRKAIFFIAKLNRADLNVLNELLEAGAEVVVDRRYDLAETADAFRYFSEGHARGDRDHRLTAAVGKVTPPAAASR